LVIPISFTDFPCADLIGGCQVVKDDIEKAFFEDEEDILWHSVASYYQASSYEQLRFYGEVSPWYTPSVSAAQLAEGGRYDVTNDVMRPAITWYRETYADNLTRLDTDGDGFIDAVYFIYSVPANAKEDPLVDDNRVFWAYTKYDNAGVANTDRPGVFHYGWSSYDSCTKTDISNAMNKDALFAETMMSPFSIRGPTLKANWKWTLTHTFTKSVTFSVCPTIIHMTPTEAIGVAPVAST
jgi:M6 family metalloprotease-like protein